MLNSNALLWDFKPNDFALYITFVPATGFLAFVPSCGPCAGCKKTLSYSVASKPASTVESAPRELFKVDCMYTPRIA